MGSKLQWLYYRDVYQSRMQKSKPMKMNLKSPFRIVVNNSTFFRHAYFYTFLTASKSHIVCCWSIRDLNAKVFAKTPKQIGACAERERGKKIMTMKNIRKLHLYGVLMSTYAKHLDSVVRALTLLTLKHSGNYVLIWWFWVIIAHNPSLSVWLVKIITKFLDFTLLGMSIFPKSKTNGIFWRIDNPLEIYPVDRYLCPLINSIVIAK